MHRLLCRCPSGFEVALKAAKDKAGNRVLLIFMSETENKIVAANFADDSQKTINVKQTALPPPVPDRLNMKAANEIGGALERLRAMKEERIATPTTDAEKASLIGWLADRLITHAPELLGAWFVVRHEYEPLVNGMTAIFTRANALAAQRMQQQQKPCCGDQCENK
jgi:hypothetical protein